jgi:hypothetical protein
MIWFWIVLGVLTLSFGFVVFRGAPYVPSRKVYINQALTELYTLNEKDVLVDIGSGDGVVLREAAKMGARAVGFEINPILVVISRLLSRKYSQISVHLVDFWLTHVPDDTTVVYVFSVTRDAKKIIKWMQNEVDRLNRPIYLINFGSELSDIKAVKKVGAYHLYKFGSLQPAEAQV